MPKVGNKTFPYTKAGKRLQKEAAKKTCLSKKAPKKKRTY